MKRSVMKQGPSTLVISLPSKWAKRFSISKGDELHVDEQNGSLTISPRKVSLASRVEIDLSGTIPMTNRICGALYKAGYDDVTIHYKTSDERDQILSLFQQVIGLDVIDQKRGTIAVKRLAQLDSEQFDELLKKQFHILHSMAEDALTGLSKNDSALLHDVISRDRTLGKFSDFCRRALIQQSCTHQRTPAIYNIVEQLEKIADVYKKISNAFVKNPIKVHQNVLTIFSRVNHFIALLYYLFYDFDLKKVAAFGQHELELRAMLDESIRTTSRQEFGLIVRLSEIVDMAFDLNGSIMVARLSSQ